MQDGITLNGSPLDINLLVSNEICMKLAKSKLLIDICQYDVDTDLLKMYTADALQRLDQKEFLTYLFSTTEKSLPRTKLIFETFLDNLNINQSEFTEIVSRYLLENSEVVGTLIDFAMEQQKYASILSNNEILVSIVDLISTYTEIALKILFKASINADIADFWKSSDASALLVDEIYSQREGGMQIESFFEDLFHEANEQTILAILPTISALEPLFQRLTTILINRFGDDSHVIHELNNY